MHIYGTPPQHVCIIQVLAVRLYCQKHPVNDLFNDSGIRYIGFIGNSGIPNHSHSFPLLDTIKSKCSLKVSWKHCSGIPLWGSVGGLRSYESYSTISFK